MEAVNLDPTGAVDGRVWGTLPYACLDAGRRASADIVAAWTRMSRGPLVQVAPPPVATLQLCFGEAQYACGRERPVVRFGRSRDNDVVVIDDFASRRHGEIMHRSGRFFVTDHSSNGTLLMRALRPQHAFPG